LTRETKSPATNQSNHNFFPQFVLGSYKLDSVGLISTGGE